MLYAEKKMDLAIKLGNREWITDTRMNMASIYEVTGLYMEALDQVALISREQIADYKQGIITTSCTQVSGYVRGRRFPGQEMGIP